MDKIRNEYIGRSLSITNIAVETQKNRLRWIETMLIESRRRAK